MNPCRIFELRDLGQLECKSYDGEDFTNAINNLHEEVKQKLQESSQKYKKKEDLKRQEVQFEVRDMV